MPNRLFLYGPGYSAGRLGRRLLGEGWQVGATARSDEQAAGLRSDGFDVVRADQTGAFDPRDPAYAEATHLLTSAPPGEAGDPCLLAVGGDLSGAPGLAWVGYLSTTGVYGNWDGGEVDETFELKPSSRRAERRVLAERTWRDLEPPAHVFRLAGIYGPGRSAIDQIAAGTAKRTIKPGHRFSRIHVDDIVEVLLASIARPNPGAVYNVCDDMPAESAHVLEHAAELMGRPPPPATPFVEAELSPMAQTFWRDDKTVSNRRIKEELGVKLRYPTYREGLAAILAGYSAG